MTIEQRAQQVWDYFIQQGWTGQAIAGMLGSMELESGITPDIHEYSGGGGYGLVQWTPGSVLINWAQTRGLDYRLMSTQLQRIQYELETRKQFDHPSMTFRQYSQSTASPEYLAEIFVFAYERPDARYAKVAERQASARKWFNLLSGSTSTPKETTNMENKYYTVVAGDSLWAISQKFGLTLDELCQLNGITVNSVIHPGDRLIVGKTTNPSQPVPTPTPNPSQDARLQKLVNWFYENMGRIKYSQALRMQENYADCSSAVYRALIYAGFLPQGTYWGSTTTLLQLEGSLLIPIQRSEARYGDIFISGYKPQGSHTGVFVSNQKIVHCVNEKHDIKETDLEGWYGGGYVYCYRLRGVSQPVTPTPQPDPTPQPGTEIVAQTYGETGRFTANQRLAIRNQPLAAAAAAAYLEVGESVNYDRVYITNAYVYISYISYSGVRRYIAIRTIKNGVKGPLFGTII
ncbi:phage tail tip lysozyme [Ignavigranum ruoffiae]|uniref:phage tail tip lysozyme n=1 Tax=Ignavigranum ruoffiae TaxID=89093 RepID=UPI0024AE2B39|nr:phage tail tip lysozyme [Ignavigranum ruoffiae]